MTPPDISRLIVRVALKDRAAFDALYRQTSAKLFGVCLRVLGDNSEAEEALQDVYVKIWTKADRFAVSDLSPISWLVAVARNHSIDRIRQRRRPPADIDEAIDIADPGPGPEALAVASGVIVATLAMLSMAPATVCATVATIWIHAVVPDATSPSAQGKSVQPPALLLIDATVRLTGRASLTTTACAVLGPALATAIV